MCADSSRGYHSRRVCTQIICNSPANASLSLSLLFPLILFPCVSSLLLLHLCPPLSLSLPSSLSHTQSLTHIHIESHAHIPRHFSTEIPQSQLLSTLSTHLVLVSYEALQSVKSGSEQESFSFLIVFTTTHSMAFLQQQLMARASLSPHLVLYNTLHGVPIAVMQRTLSRCLVLVIIPRPDSVYNLLARKKVRSGHTHLPRPASLSL